MKPPGLPLSNMANHTVAMPKPFGGGDIDRRRFPAAADAGQVGMHNEIAVASETPLCPACRVRCIPRNTPAGREQFRCGESGDGRGAQARAMPGRGRNRAIRTETRLA